MNNKLRDLRAEKGWSQADLAQGLGVSRQTVNALETGRYDPSLPLAFKIAQLFSASIEEIFHPEGFRESAKAVRPKRTSKPPQTETTEEFSDLTALPTHIL